MIPWNRCWGLPALGSFALVAMLSQSLHAAEIDPRFDVHLIKDIDPDPSSYGSMPHSFTPVGDKVYFAAGGLFSADELWVTSGDAASTYEVSPGLAVGTLGASGNRLFMHAQGASGQIGLWAIDSAVGVPYMVKEVQSATFQSYVGDFFDLNGTMLLFASDDVHGYEPWSSYGTEATTQFLVDTRFGPTYSPPYVPWAEYAGRAYVTSDHQTATGDWHMAVWGSDGTVAGTSALHISQGILGRTFTFQNRICFVEYLVRYSLRCSDGTLSGTTETEFPDISLDLYYNNFVAGSDGVFFKAFTPDLGEELWVTDGTAAGTRAVSDIPGPWIDSVHEIINIGGTIYFTAGVFATQVWVVNEGARSATPVTPLDEAAMFPRHLTDFNGTLVFTMVGYHTAPSRYTEQLWAVIPKTLQPVRVALLEPISSYALSELAVVGQSLYFDGDDGEGREPWVWTNRRPQTVEDKFMLDEGHWMSLDILANDSDDLALAADSIEIVEQPRFGEAAIVDGKIRYKGARAIPADQFSYRVRDTQGGVSDTTTVTVGRAIGTGAMEFAWLLLLAIACIARCASPTRRIGRQTI